MSEFPLIWTTNGNVPADSLKLETAWNVQDTGQRVGLVILYIKLALRYTDANGELVREDAHVYSRTGLNGANCRCDAW